MAENRPDEEGVPSDISILADLLQILGPYQGQPISLIQLHEKLPLHLAQLAKDADGVLQWLRRYPQLLQLSGPKGQEEVMLTIGKSGPPPATPTGNAPGPALPGPVPMGLADEMAVSSVKGDGNQVVGDDDCANPCSVQLRGLPFRANTEDVRTFLGPHAAQLNPERTPNICLLQNKEGRPSGFGRVFFVSPQAAHKCRDALHKKQMGDRYVEVLVTDRHSKARKKAEELRENVFSNVPMDAAAEAVERERVLNECREHLSLPGRHHTLLSMLGIALSEPARNYLRRANWGLKHFLARYPNEFRVDGPKGCEKVHWISDMMPSMYTLPEAGWTADEPSTPDTRLLSPTRPPPSGGFIATPSDWGTPQVSNPAMNMDFSSYPSWPSYGFPPWNAPWGWEGPKAKKKPVDGNPPRSHAHLHPESHPFAEESAEVEEDKSGVAALRLRGLPFSVTVQDVLTFFAQYNVADTIHEAPNSAKLLPKANGRPSGQAVVQMRSRKDAEVAQKALNHKYVGGRYIEVFVYGNEDEGGAPAADSTWEWSNSYNTPWGGPWGNMPPSFSQSEDAKDGSWDALIMQAMLQPSMASFPAEASRPTLQV